MRSHRDSHHHLFYNHFLPIVLRCFKTVLLTMLAIWTIGLLISRVYIFHTAYIHHLQTIEEEKWLLEQCSDPVFAANLKTHIDICTSVQENTKKNGLLIALHASLQASSLCGVLSCWEIMVYLQSGGVSMITQIGLFLMVSILIIIPMFNTISNGVRQLTAL